MEEKMKDVLFIIPRNNAYRANFPLGIAYLSSVLKQNGYNYWDKQKTGLL